MFFEDFNKGISNFKKSFNTYMQMILFFLFIGNVFTKIAPFKKLWLQFQH